MHAAVFYGVGDLRYEQVPVPAVEAEEVLVQVRACGLCQSDIKKLRYPLLDPPRIFGHETSGTIVRVGAAVTDWQPGDRVVVMHHIPCFHCPYCLNENYSMCRVYKEVTTTAGFIPSGGGFAEYVKVPGHIVRSGGLIAIPEGVSFEEASFVEPTNCCLKAIKKAQVQPGQTILITGAGPIGLMFAMLCRHFGARPIVTDLLPSRIERAKNLGAAAALDAAAADLAQQVRALTGGLGVDTALLAVPSTRAFDQALALTRKGGRILFFAEFPEAVQIPLDPNVLYRQEIDLMGSYSSSYKVQSLAAQIVFERLIDVSALISDFYPLAELAAAVEQALHPAPETCKILIRP
ncbi:zinc-dependent dehydrogenase [Gloeobacter kilaueensis]